jgi:hypothetical protein
MARRKRRIIRIIGWIVLGFFSLILIITLGFYLGRGWIMKRAVNYLNDQQPGEITMEQMNLIPLVNFPDITLQLRNVSYYEQDLHPDSLYQEPLLSINEVYVRLDVVELVRGDIEVSQARIDNGFIRYEIYEDSVSNFEKALGIRFADAEKKEAAVLPKIKIDLEELELNNMLAFMEDHLQDNYIELHVNRWGSSFNYLPDRISSTLELNIDINNVKYLTYKSETSRNLLFDSEVLIDPGGREIHVEPSYMKISGLELETWGTYVYDEEPAIDMVFRATNEGLEVLNYLFKGILDLDEVEQIGGGKIYLSGNVTGNMANRLPEVRINGTADQLGFRIKPIQKDITDITFQFYATNGKKEDMSEGWVQVNDFFARFPEGTIQGDLLAENMVEPRLAMKVQGDVNLTGLEEMLRTEVISGLGGNLSLDGNVNGSMNMETGEFLNDSSYLNADLEGIRFSYQRDSVTLDSVKGLNGSIYVQQDFVETGDLHLEYNGDSIHLKGRFEQFIPYILGYERELKVTLAMASEEFHPGSLIRDSAINSRLGETWNGLHFKLGAKMAAEELRQFLEHDSIPRISVSLDSLGVILPIYAEIADISAEVRLGRDTASLIGMTGTIGSSQVQFSGSLLNYESLIHKDTGAMLQLDYHISSDLLLASDLFTINQAFLLPESFQAEKLENLTLSGTLELPASSLETEGIPENLSLAIHELEASYSGYPLPVSQFHISLRKDHHRLYIDQLQGIVGNSHLNLNAVIENYTDTVLSNLNGYVNLQSDLLDLNELLGSLPPSAEGDTIRSDAAGSGAPPLLYQFDYPDLDLTLDVGELRFNEYILVGLKGKLSSSREKIFNFDQLSGALKRGGSAEFTGQLNVSDPNEYALSTNFEVKDFDVNTLDFEMKSGEETYSLKENFRGLVSSNGLAEVFLTPELALDLPNTTAVFNVRVVDGALINFTPLQAAAKYLDNKDLNHVRFATLENSFPMTVANSNIIVPLTIVESTIGQMLIEGEQGFDGSYLYLMRLPAWLVRGAARSRLSASGDDQKEDQIQEYKSGTFMNITVWGEGEESEVKLGDRRDRYR